MPTAQLSPRPYTRGPVAAPAYYVPLPRPLLAALRDSPLAIGVYALVARVFRATKAAVPLSPADIAAYDPASSPAAALRALLRLRELGYLLLAPSGGRRNAYLPAWGMVRGAPRAWDLAAPILGRPPHITAAHLPQELLDGYLGRLEPHAQHGAHISRYLTTPLLSLADVGRYALTKAGYPVSGDTLARLGLLADGQALPPPPLEEMLALASQRRLFDAGSPIALTAAGWARLGLTPPAPLTPRGTPLVFVSAGTLGDHLGRPIAQPIARGPATESPPAASQRPRGRSAPAAAGSHGVVRSEGNKETTPQPPHSERPAAGGGGDIAPRKEAEQPAAGASASATQADGAVVRRLLALGVRRDVATGLAGRQLAQVERVLALARARQGVRDVAGWVVAALRALPEEEPVAPPPPKVSDLAILIHPGLSNHERVRWLTRFRNADLADRPAILERFRREHPQ